MRTEVNLITNIDLERSFSNTNSDKSENKYNDFEQLVSLQSFNSSNQSKILTETPIDYSFFSSPSQDNCISRDHQIFSPLSCISFLTKSEHKPTKTRSHNNSKINENKLTKTTNHSNSQTNDIKQRIGMTTVTTNPKGKSDQTYNCTHNDHIISKLDNTSFKASPENANKLTLTTFNTTSESLKSNLLVDEDLSVKDNSKAMHISDIKLKGKRRREDIKGNNSDDCKRNFKKKKGGKQKKQVALNTVNKITKKIKILNELYPQEQYLKDLEKLKQKKNYEIMMTHFPKAFSQDNLYVHHNLLNLKRGTKQNIHLSPFPIPSFLRDTHIQMPHHIKPLWKPLSEGKSITKF